MSQPTWAPDGTRLAFTCNFDPQPLTERDLVINVDGSVSRDSLKAATLTGRQTERESFYD